MLRCRTWLKTLRNCGPPSKFTKTKAFARPVVYLHTFRRNLNVKELGGLSSKTLVAIFNAAWRASQDSIPQDITVSEDAARDAGLAILDVLSATLKCHEGAGSTTLPGDECPREAPAGFGAPISFEGSGWPGGGWTHGDTSSWTPSNNKSSGNGNSSPDNQSHSTKFSVDTFGNPKAIDQPGVRFSCPYRKHSPNVHTASEFPECATTGFEADHDGFTRLKSHIRKCHGALGSYECSRCGTGFALASQAEAHERPGVCPIRPRKIGRVRAEMLTSRRVHLGSTWVEKWISIFCLCFPEFKENAAGITYC